MNHDFNHFNIYDETKFIYACWYNFLFTCPQEKSITAFAESVKKSPATGASTAAGGAKAGPTGGFVKSKRKASSAASGGSKFKFPRLIE